MKMAAKKKAAKKKVAKKKVAKKAAPKKKIVKKAAKKPASKRKPSAAFMKPMMPSAALAMVIGAKAMPRTEVTKKLWDYIKRNRLQDAVNRRMINADANLTAVFGGKRQVSMFEMTKLVSKHPEVGGDLRTRLLVRVNSRSPAQGPGFLFEWRVPSPRPLPAGEGASVLSPALSQRERGLRSSPTLSPRWRGGQCPLPHPLPVG
jgi:hypothetical protein